MRREYAITEDELAEALKLLSITQYPERDAKRIFDVLGDMSAFIHLPKPGGER